MNYNAEIETIGASVNIVDIISSYLPLTQKGKNYFGVCPFHEDHAPSMSVSVDKQIYKCFSCGAAGNVFTFVKDYENVSFMEAVKIVAEKSGLTFHGNITNTKKVTKNNVELEVMDLALKFYQNNLNTKEGQKAKEYLENRSLNKDAIKEFDLGLALDNKYPLNKLLISKKYSLETLINLGLVHQNGDQIYDTFNKRVIFPIHDLDGNPVGFTGRIYEDSDQAKYLNSKESNIFKKGKILYNYHRAKAEIKRKKEVIIVEGNMDAIRMSLNGFKNVIALMGTSLTIDQVNIIKNLKTKVILMFDNDSAGEQATFNNGNILISHGITPLVIRLSGEKDPDSYILKNGPEAMLSNLKKPISFLDFKLKYLRQNRDLSNTNELIGYIKDVIENIKELDDIEREVVITKISTEYNISKELLNNELKKYEKNKKEINKVEKHLEKNKKMKYDIACQNILYFMMNDAKYIEKFRSDLGYFNVKKYRDLVNVINYYYSINNNISISEFLTYISSNEEIYETALEIMSTSNIEELDMNTFIDFLKVASTEMNKNKIKDIKEQIATELDEHKKIELLNRLVELKKGV